MEFDQDSEEVGSERAGIPTDDPVAKLTKWDPLVTGGANFRTHKMKKVGFHSYVSAPTVGYHIFYGIFLLFGLGALVGAYFTIKESLLVVLMLSVMGVLFTAVGVYLGRKAHKPFTIDLDLGTFYRGRSYDPYDDNAEGDSGSIRDIHAIQILVERVSGDKSTYPSYEINLVLKDGRRVNVMDHGRHKRISEEVNLLKEVLDVPVWDTTNRF